MTQPYQPGVADPDIPDINNPVIDIDIELRLASEADLPRLKEIVTAGSQPDDGPAVNGQMLRGEPDSDEYWTGFDHGLRSRARNEYGTCIVAETKNRDGDGDGSKKVIGYCVWIWVEYSVDEEGRKVRKTGMLPRVGEIWEKFLPGPRPSDEVPNYTPRILDGSEIPFADDGLLSQDTGFSAYWLLREIVVDPAYDEVNVQDEMLRRICRFADAENILLCTFWPILAAGGLARAGFMACEVKKYGVDAVDGEIKVCMALMRRLPVAVPSAVPKGDGGGDGGDGKGPDETETGR